MSFKDFNEVIIAFQDPNSDTKSTWYRQKSDNNSNSTNNNGLCLQCNSPRKNKNFFPFCGAICKGAWNAARGKDDKGSDKNTMLGFSEVFTQ